MMVSLRLDGMMVSLRLKDELVAEIDRVAPAQGQSRSAWMALALARAALVPSNDSLPVPGASEAEGEGDHPDEQVRVTVCLARSEIEAIDTVGAPMGLSRNEWIKRALRWQLWDKAGALRVAPVTQAELGNLRKQVLSIGRNINQAVHAMNAANQPGSTLDVARIAEPFLETCADLKALLFDLRRRLSSSVGAEVGYWTGAYAEAGAVSFQLSSGTLDELAGVYAPPCCSRNRVRRRPICGPVRRPSTRSGAVRTRS